MQLGSEFGWDYLDIVSGCIKGTSVTGVCIFWGTAAIMNIHEVSLSLGNGGDLYISFNWYRVCTVFSQ